MFSRPTTNSTTPTWLASSGIRRSHGHDWSFTCKANLVSQLIKAAPRRRIRRRTMSRILMRTLPGSSESSQISVLWLGCLLSELRPEAASHLKCPSLGLAVFLSS